MRLRSRMICIAIVVSFASLARADEKVIRTLASKPLFVFSAKQEVNGPVELVRMEANKIVSRTSLGFNVARAASSTKMVAFGVVRYGQNAKTYLKTWDLKSGNLLSDIEIKDLKVSYIPLFIGVAGDNGADVRTRLTLYEAENQVVYVGRAQEPEAPRIPWRGRAVPPPKDVAVFVAVDISTGESFKIKSPKGIPNLPQWTIVRGKLGTRLEDGSFATYSGVSHSFTKVTEIKGIAKEWSTFFPNIGLAKETKDGWQILSRDDLTPLDQPIDIRFEAGSEKSRGIFKMANGDIGQWSVVRNGGVSSEYVVVDVTSHAEVKRVQYPFDATTAFRAEDGSQLLLVDDGEKKGLWVNPAMSVTSEVDFSWAELPYLAPVFQK